ncbi:MAG: hypothetical protein ABW166_15175 [Sedimenticola sp.]
MKVNTTDSKSYADCYHKNRSAIDEQASVILELISDLIGYISKTSILDVGSGPGRLAIPIGQQAHKMVCIESDLSAKKQGHPSLTQTRFSGGCPGIGGNQL